MIEILVGGLAHEFFFPHTAGNDISFALTVIFFQMGRVQPPTSDHGGCCCSFFWGIAIHSIGG